MMTVNVGVSIGVKWGLYGSHGGGHDWSWRSVGFFLKSIDEDSYAAKRKSRSPRPSFSFVNFCFLFHFMYFLVYEWVDNKNQKKVLPISSLLSFDSRTKLVSFRLFHCRIDF